MGECNLPFERFTRIVLHSYPDPTSSPDPINEDDHYENATFRNLVDDFFVSDYQESAPPSEANVPEAEFDESDHPNLIRFLKAFLKYTKELFSCVSPYHTTQSNESINSIKAKLANKNTCWHQSFKTRMALTILHKDSPYLYYIDLVNQLQVPKLSENSINILKKYRMRYEKKN